jgi:carbon-monoxide dehydrogenase catalytic subunit|tara:strand:- start:6202 stop:6459 length:258 start_codon:yes stop_codon:yes gene_type:complete
VKGSSVSGNILLLQGSTPYSEFICDYLFKDLEKIYGGMWDLEADPIKHAQKMIAHIDKKRRELGIDMARERVLMDMADRQKLETA